jgi:hypothetical protein
MRNVWFSRRKRCNSSRSSPLKSGSRSPASICASLIQWRNDTSLIPNSSATRRCDFPVKRTSSIA